MATVITSLATVLPVVGKTVVSWLWGGFLNIEHIEASDCSDVVYSTLLDAGIGILDISLMLSLYIYNYFMNNINNSVYENSTGILNLLLDSLIFAGPGDVLNYVYYMYYVIINWTLLLLFQNNVKMLYIITQSAGLLSKQSITNNLAFGRFSNCCNKDNKRMVPILPSENIRSIFYFSIVPSTRGDSAVRRRRATPYSLLSLLYLSFLSSLSSLSSGHLLNNKSQRLNARELMWLVDFVKGDGSFSLHKNGKYAI